MLQSHNTLEGYFNDLFACDEERASQFVLSLVRTKDKTKFSWGIQVLNEASNKNNKQIADVLINNLSESELLNVFDELLKGEASDTWCRGNKLLPILIQHYMAKEECRKFKDFLWTSLFSLAKPISNIQVQQRVSMVMTPDSFTAETGDIISLQKEFSAVMKNMLDPKKLPPLMQKLLCLAYSNLAQRKDVHNKNNNHMRVFLGFILLRFINPIVQQEANGYSMDQNLKMWYMKILPAAIQSLSSPLNNTNTTPDKEKTLQEEIFDPVTKNTSLRTELFGIIRTGFNLVDPSDEEDAEQHSRTQSLVDLDIPACIRELNDLLKAEEFSGLSFKSNGSVTPRRDDLKPSIMSFLPHAPSSDDENDEANSSLSPTPLNGFGD